MFNVTPTQSVVAMWGQMQAQTWLIQATKNVFAAISTQFIVQLQFFELCPCLSFF